MKGPKAPKQYRTKEFLDLQAKWYEKLEAEGFEDLEWNHPDGQSDSPFIKKAVSNLKAVYNVEAEEHFRRCTAHLMHGKFLNKLDEFIFKCYVNGESYRDIIKSIVARRGFRKKPYSVFFIYYRINKILTHMNEERLWEKDLTVYKPYMPKGGRKQYKRKDSK